jgi:hypothetical protein
VAMKITGHKTEAVYRRYAIVSEADLAGATRRLEQVRIAQIETGTTVAPASGAQHAGSDKLM